MGCKAARQSSLQHEHLVLPAESMPDSIGVSNIPEREPGVLRLVTYNLWFKEAGLAERMSAVVEILRSCDPDIVALQEVTEPVLGVLMGSFDVGLWEVLLQTPREWYFTALLVRSSIGIRSESCAQFDVTNMARGLQQAVVDVPDFGSLCVATSHLESPQPGVAATVTRHQQRQQAFDMITLADRRQAVWLGDMNWMEADGALALPGGWVDAWQELRPGEPGSTYHANHGRAFAKVCRFDRVLTHGLRPVTIFRVGTEKLEDSVHYPSDHYGLFCLLKG